MIDRPTTLAAAFGEARGKGIARLDAELMLAGILARSRTWLIAHDDAVLLDSQAAQWRRWLGRRAGGEPLAYLLGEKEFAGLMLKITADVLVPRPETELLVEWADELLRGRQEAAEVLDLGTGTGAVALAIKARHRSAKLTATDISAEALVVARGNAARHTLAIEFIQAAWWSGLEGRRFDLVVSNPPYVAGDDLALVALRHEPRMALTSGPDGTEALACIASGSAPHLHPGGWLVLEHGFAQGPVVRHMLKRAAFTAIETRRDLAGHERASAGRRTSQPS